MMKDLKDDSGNKKTNKDTNKDKAKNDKTKGRRGPVVRVLPYSKKDLPKLSEDPAEAKRVRDNNLCSSCRESGHDDRTSSKCIFNSDKGRFK
jgi:hypothetical protein